MALRESQKDMQEHSAKKVELLHHYLDAYINVIGSDRYTKALHCFDLFCGEGVYPNGKEGSPILFAKKLLKASRLYPETQFSFHYNDKDKEKVENVKLHLNSLPGIASAPLKIFGSHLSFLEILSDVKAQVDKLKNEKAFCFIDPYGYKEIKPEIISDLMAGNKQKHCYFCLLNTCFGFLKTEPLKV